MNKRFFLAALAAVALTMGFTACSEDDENGPAQGDYKLTVNVHADVMGSDHEEFTTICNAYRSAFGLSKIDENSGMECVDFNGKDSLDCVASIQKCCAKAETALTGKSWADRNIIAIRDTATNAVIYTKQYGTSADNSVSRHMFDRVEYSSFIATVHNIPDDFCVKAVYIDSRSNPLSLSSDLWYDYYVGRDLNQGAGGNYVYPSYMGRAKGADEMWRSLDPTAYIGGLLVLVNESGTNPPAEFWFENCLYKIAVDSNTKTYSFDLNHKAGGPYMYLYTTSSLYTRKILSGDRSVIYSADHDLTNDYTDLVRGVTYKSDKSIVLTQPKGVDLNMGAGGDWMYWREYYFFPW